MSKKIFIIIILSLVPVIGWTQGKIELPNVSKKPATATSTSQGSNSKNSAYRTNSSQPADKNTLKFEILDRDKRTAKLTSCKGSKGDLIIPSSVVIDNENYTVTEIGKEAFYDCKGLTSVTIPSSVTKIEEGAFRGCGNLNEIIVDSNNKYFSSSAGVLFNKQKTNLLQCPRGLKGNYSIPNSVTEIGDEAFHGCSELTSIIIPNSVTVIGNEAFYYCSGLTSVTIPNSVTEIGEQAFEKCSNLNEIIVHTDNKYFSTSRGVLYNKQMTKLIQFPGGFEGNYSIPNSVIEIGEWAFYGCHGLTSVKIPNSVTKIGNGAFYDCRGLISITIPNSVTEIDVGAFAGCDLKEIIVDSNNKDFSSSAGVLFNKQKSKLIQFPGGYKGNYTIPNSVTEIERAAFSGCIWLKSFIIPNTVTEIGREAFFCCFELTSVTIPNTVTEIGREAFYACYALRNVYLPRHLQNQIEEGNVFEDCPNVNLIYK